MKGPLPPDEKFEAVNNCRLDTIKKEKSPENLSLFCDDKAEKDKEDYSKMASKISQPRDGMIKD